MIRQTSIEAYLDLPPTERLKQEILRVLEEHPHGLTDSEIIAAIGPRWDRLEPRVRRHELGKDGRITYLKDPQGYERKRKCSVTNKAAMVWVIRQ